ncbi:MAG: hypothetical protein ACRDVL_06250 [Acidimicrobiia bacterium]
MSSYDARLRLSGETGLPLGVEVDLTDGHMKVKSGPNQLADWEIDRIRVSAMQDGFHVRAEGEEVILNVSDDAKFAIELGLRTAYPGLRRRMSALMRDDADLS